MTAYARTTTLASETGRTRHEDLQAMLQGRQRELRTVSRSRLGQESADRSGDGLDETEHAEADIQEHIEVALIQMREETLVRLREALVRLEAGDYGDCAECNGQISEKRLKALPFAVRCTACETLHEQAAARERRSGSSKGVPHFFADQVGM